MSNTSAHAYNTHPSAPASAPPRTASSSNSAVFHIYTPDQLLTAHHRPPTVPPPSANLYLNVEYPGFVLNARESVSSLHGASSLSAALTSSEPVIPLQLPHRSTDGDGDDDNRNVNNPFQTTVKSSPLFGELKPLLHKAAAPSLASAAYALRRAEQQRGDTPAVGSTEHAFEFLMRVKKKKKTRGASSAPSSEVTAEVLGQVSSLIHFPGLCDFQLNFLPPITPIIRLDHPILNLPAQHTNMETHVNNQEEFMPNRPGPYVLTPSLFSRYDYSRDYEFVLHENSQAVLKAAAAEMEDEKAAENAGAKKQPATPSVSAPKRPLRKLDGDVSGADEGEDLESDGGADGNKGGADGRVGKRRKARRYFTSYKSAIPVSVPDAFASYESKPLVQVLKRIFDERPIWSTDAIMHKLATKIPERNSTTHDIFDISPHLTRQDLLRHLVAVAYRFTGGPWRNLWIRIGFDPRITPNAEVARMLQLVDYRFQKKLFDILHQQEATTNSSAVSSSNPNLPYVSAASFLSPAKPTNSNVDASSSNGTLSTALQLDIRFTRVPPRQHYSYQLIDLEGDEIQTLMRSATVAPECSDLTGWFDVQTMNALRSLMHKRVSQWALVAGVSQSELEALEGAADSSIKKKKKKRHSLGRVFAAHSAKTGEEKQDSTGNESERKRKKANDGSAKAVKRPNANAAASSASPAPAQAPNQANPSALDVVDEQAYSHSSDEDYIDEEDEEFDD